MQHDNSLGMLHVSSPPGQIDVLPGYSGPRTEADIRTGMPPRAWRPIQAGEGRRKGLTAAIAGVDLIQIDGRAYTDDFSWTGLRFLFKVDNLSVKEDETTFSLFATHLGRAVNGVANWTEIGVIRSLYDPRYRLYTYDPQQNPDWSFFGEMHPGEVYEFAIRLNEADGGPYRYETYCSGLRVRQGTLLSLECQVDISSESWTPSGILTDGDSMQAVEGWVNYPPGKARWLDGNVKVTDYTTNPSEKQESYGPPAARKFFVRT